MAYRPASAVSIYPFLENCNGQLGQNIYNDLTIILYILLMDFYSTIIKFEWMKVSKDIPGQKWFSTMKWVNKSNS